MSISPRSICRPSNWLAVLALGVASAGVRGLQPVTAQPSAELRPFLDEFKARKETPLVGKDVNFASAVGRVEGFWVRQDRKEPLPAILAVFDDATSAEWMRGNARHFASIGYEVLSVRIRRPPTQTAAKAPFADEKALAELSAAVRWLRGRSEVMPNRLGVVGWGWSGGQALVLAGALPVQACVVCEAPLPDDSSVLVGLRQTPILGVFAGQDRAGQAELPAFQKFLASNQTPHKFHVADGVVPGFMGPPDRKPYAHDAAEDAWVTIYSFLETHVEDLRPAETNVKPIATIADIMRAVNEPAGLRGAVSKALEEEPAGARQWGRIRANAALMAEAGVWLQMRAPDKGPVGHWKEQAQAYTAAAESIVAAANKRDYPAARAALTNLAKQCAACHEAHR